MSNAVRELNMDPTDQLLASARAAGLSLCGLSSQLVRPPCLHCGKPASRSRQLCWTCYYTPEIRELYPTEKLPRGLGIENKTGRVPTPTMALPGTPEKVEVLARRAAAGERLWHPEDAKWDDGSVKAEAS